MSYLVGSGGYLQVRSHMGGSYINMGSVAIWEVPDLRYGNSFQTLMYSVQRLELVVSALRYIMRGIGWWRLTVEC
jgi:hypothetical protein